MELICFRCGVSLVKSKKEVHTVINIEVAGCLSIGESGLIGPQASDT